MFDWDEIEKFRTLIMDLGLPFHDFALCGITCPYCGKTDRIHQLERPSEIGDAPEDYIKYWEAVENHDGLVLCKFCGQVLLYNENENTVSPLVEIQ